MLSSGSPYPSRVRRQRKSCTGGNFFRQAPLITRVKRPLSVGVDLRRPRVRDSAIVIYRGTNQYSFLRLIAAHQPTAETTPPGAAPASRGRSHGPRRTVPSRKRSVEIRRRVPAEALMVNAPCSSATTPVPCSREMSAPAIGASVDCATTRPCHSDCAEAAGANKAAWSATIPSPSRRPWRERKGRWFLSLFQARSIVTTTSPGAVRRVVLE